jgi:hypothetical protein
MVSLPYKLPEVIEYPFKFGSVAEATFEALFDFTVINLVAKVIVLVAELAL